MFQYCVMSFGFISYLPFCSDRCNGEILSITFSKETRNLKWSMINQVEFARVMDDDGATKLQIRSVTSLSVTAMRVDTDGNYPGFRNGSYS